MTLVAAASPSRHNRAVSSLTASTGDCRFAAECFHEFTNGPQRLIDIGERALQYPRCMPDVAGHTQGDQQS